MNNEKLRGDKLPPWNWGKASGHEGVVVPIVRGDAPWIWIPCPPTTLSAATKKRLLAGLDEALAAILAKEITEVGPATLFKFKAVCALMDQHYQEVSDVYSDQSTRS